jgi:hypothetical protein
MKRLLLVFALAFAALAQDQTVVIQAVPRAISPPTATAPGGEVVTMTQPDPITAALAPDLIQKALDHPAAANRYYLIHVTTPEDAKTAFATETWNTYQQQLQHPSPLQRLSDPWTDWFAQKRVFGSREAGLVYMYWIRSLASSSECAAFNEALSQFRSHTDVKDHLPDSLTPVPSLRENASQPSVDWSCTASHQLDASDPKANWIEHRAQQLAYELVHEKLLLNNTRVPAARYTLIDAASRTNLVAMPGSRFISAHSKAILDSITYKIAITKKIPTPLANLRDTLSFAGVAGMGAPQFIAITLPDYVPFAGGKEFQVEPLPSDIVVTSLAADPAPEGEKSEQKELSKNTWDNERRYPIDFSLALPLTSYKEATVDLNDGNITAREVKKQRLAAMLDFSPWWLFDHKAGFETKNIKAQLLTVVMVGIPIASKPLQHPVLAGGIGMNKAHFFFGTQFNRKRQPPTPPVAGNADSATVTSPSGPIVELWGTQFVWGLNFSVKTVTDLLKSKKMSTPFARAARAVDRLTALHMTPRNRALGKDRTADHRHSRSWGWRANVVGIGIARKAAGADSRGPLGVTIFVRRKFAKSRLAKNQFVPAELRLRSIGVTVTTDVVQLRGSLIGHAPSDRIRPIQPALEVSHEFGEPGTMCADVRWNQRAGTLFGLGCSHTIARCGIDVNPDTDLIEQPQSVADADQNSVGTLTPKFSTITFGGAANIADFAIFQLNAAAGAPSNRIVGQNRTITAVDRRSAEELSDHVQTDLFGVRTEHAEGETLAFHSS